MFNLRNFFLNPKVAFSIFSIFIIVYIVILGREGAFSKKFLHFGPSEKTKFLTLKLDNWTKVITVYSIGFFSSLITTYYSKVAKDKIHSLLWNPAYKKNMPLTRTLMGVILIGEPFLYWVLGIINFFITLTLELQYILPKFIGTIIIEIPYGLYKANQKKYKCRKKDKKI